MGELDYYENADLWSHELYLQPRELKRFETCRAVIPPGTTTLLDAGCGNGAFLAYLEEDQVSYRLYGLERSAAARQAKVCRAEVQDGSIDQLPFDDDSFDLVAAMEVIEHLPYGVYEKSLSELQRVAKQHILISVPYRESRRFVECPYCGCKFNPNYHMRSFDEKVMEHLFPDFRLAQLRSVEVDDYIFAPLIRRTYRYISHGKDFTRTALCPQCGFNRRDGNLPTQASVSNRLRKQFQENWKDKLPTTKRPLWFVALYERVV